MEKRGKTRWKRKNLELKQIADKKRNIYEKYVRLYQLYLLKIKDILILDGIEINFASNELFEKSVENFFLSL